MNWTLAAQKPQPASYRSSGASAGSLLDVDFALLPEFDRHLLHARVADLLRQFHRAELRPAHRTEVRHLRAVGRQRLVVEGARRHRIHREVELVFPPELE